jgi:hypothetical protein
MKNLQKQAEPECLADLFREVRSRASPLAYPSTGKKELLASGSSVVFPCQVYYLPADLSSAT